MKNRDLDAWDTDERFLGETREGSWKEFLLASRFCYDSRLLRGHAMCLRVSHMGEKQECGSAI